MTTALRILLLVALQTAALGYMIYDRIAILNSPDVVTLKVKPIDPSDMFRGDYVILAYDISTLEPNDLPGDDNYVVSRPVFVTLAQHDGAWVVTSINNAMPQRSPGTVVLRGTVTSMGGTFGNSLHVDYGIESFFVPQGQGKVIEDERQKGDLSAEIAIDADGRGAIKSLRRADGTVMYVEGLF